MILQSKTSDKFGQQGYTLLELVIVVLVLSILIALAKTNSTGIIQSLRLRSAADATKSELVIARTRAIANPYIHCGVYFDFVSKPQKMIVFFDDGAGAAKDNYQYDPGVDKTYIKTYDLPQGITFSKPPVNAVVNNAIVFRGDGSAKFGGRIILTNKNGNSRIIDVLPSTGRVKIITP